MLLLASIQVIFFNSTGLAGISLGVDCDIEHEVTVVNHNHFMI